MTWLLIGIGVALLIWAVLAAALSAQPGTLLRIVRVTVIALSAAAAVVLAVLGKFRLAMVPAALALFLLLPWRKATAPAGGGWGPSAGSGSGASRSEASSRYLRMTLDHGSGEMRGEVVEGPMRGTPLDNLELDDLLDLLRMCRADDPDGERLLVSWLDRSRFAGRWREADAAHGGAGAADATMTRQQAAEILGVSPDADEGEVQVAYRKLMAANHPDRGGSPWLAQQINRARDVLLRG